MTRRLLLPIALVCLSACSQDVPTAALPLAVAAPAATPTQSVPGDVVAPADETADSALLSVVFVEKPSCASGEAATITAKWDMRPLGVSTVAIFVENPAHPIKLWVEAGASGEETTGKWIQANTRLTVQDRTSGKVLATRLLEKPCTP